MLTFEKTFSLNYTLLSGLIAISEDYVVSTEYCLLYNILNAS